MRTALVLTVEIYDKEMKQAGGILFDRKIVMTKAEQSY